MRPIPAKGVGEHIRKLAAHHNVAYTKTVGDEMACAITRLSGDEVEMDEVELLLIALERAGVVSSEDVLSLHVSYLREKFAGSS